jgi:polysaccharide export outer membrane protein
VRLEIGIVRLEMKLSWIVMSMFVITASVSCACLAAEKPDGANGTAHSATVAASADTSPSLRDRNPRYRLRKGDSFDLEFALSPEFNQTIPVQPDGYITLKSVGTIFVEGQTLPELTETIKQAYTKILHDPVVTIALKDFEKPYFIAAGQVGKPGKYDLRSDMTLTEAIAVAGGFTPSSKHSQVVLFRPAANGMMEARLLNIKKMLNSRDLTEDVHLMPGDMLFVPQNQLSKIQKFLPNSSMGMYMNSPNL